MIPVTHAAFSIVVLAIIWSVYRLQRNPNVDFNLLDLLMENGRVSKVSAIVMGSFIVTSWLMVDLQINNKMTEGYIGLYGGMWVSPLLVRLFNPTPASETSTRTAVVETTTTKG